MSFFKKSSKDSEKNKNQQPGGGSYPKQAPYPTQQAAAPGPAYGEQPPAYTPQAPPQYGGAPGAPQTGVPYAPPQGPPQQPAHYPQQPQYGYAAAPPPGAPYYPQMSGAGVYPLHPQIPAGAHVVGHGTFDAGARFNAGGSVNIPPPPPGMMPNAAQVAAAHGGTVTMGQAKSGFFSGGSDGGMATHID